MGLKLLKFNNFSGRNRGQRRDDMPSPADVVAHLEQATQKLSYAYGETDNLDGAANERV